MSMPRHLHHGPSGFGLAGRRVLIVEDEIIAIEEAQGLLDQPIDIAILDINLDGESVWPVARALHDRGVPYVLASANCDDARATDPVFADVPCFDKPVPIPRLIATIANLVNDDSYSAEQSGAGPPARAAAISARAASMSARNARSLCSRASSAAPSMRPAATSEG